jgi:hypothetical protein
METFYLICAGLGGTVIVLQFLASAFGIGHDGDHDFDHDADHGDGFLGMLTARSVAAAVTFFGLSGLTALSQDVPPMGALAAAVMGGVVALYSVASIMNMFKKLKQDGTAKLEDAVGLTGTCYLRIPANNTAPGKVSLTLQNRTVECEAFSINEVPTGRTVRVIGLRDPNTLDVELL